MKGVPPPCGCVDQNAYNQSAVAILSRCNKDEIAAKMRLDQKDLEEIFPIIAKVHRFVAPRLASDFFILVRGFIISYKHGVDKQKRLIVLLSNVFRMSYKIPPDLQGQFCSAVHDRMGSFDELISFLQEWGNAVKSNAEKEIMTPSNF